MKKTEKVAEAPMERLELAWKRAEELGDLRRFANQALQAVDKLYDKDNPAAVDAYTIIDLLFGKADRLETRALADAREIANLEGLAARQ